MIRRSIVSITALWTEPGKAPGLRIFLLTAFYLAVFVGLVVLYGPGHFRAPRFVYQDF
jgi:hypothetical protein